MNENLLKELARELATKVNNLVDIPIIKEEAEQAVIEMIVLLMLEPVINRLRFRNVVEMSPRA